jgi:hypothetical protein
MPQQLAPFTVANADLLRHPGSWPFIAGSNGRPAGIGGSENYTVGQARELNRRGVPAQVITVSLGDKDGREDFTGVPFRSLPTLDEVGELDSTVVFVNEPHPVPTKHPAFLILHNPPRLWVPPRLASRRVRMAGAALRMTARSGGSAPALSCQIVSQSTSSMRCRTRLARRMLPARTAASRCGRGGTPASARSES